MQKTFTSVDELIEKGHSKEQEPVWHSELQENPEYKPRDEVKPFVEVRQEKVAIPHDLKNRGVEGEKTIPVLISDEAVVRGLHAPIYSSLRWLAESALYFLKKAHIALKKIHGHVVRVMKK